MLAMAFRKPFPASGLLFYTVMTGIMVPGILLSLGMATLLREVGIGPAWWHAGLGVHVVWTLPFGFLVMMAVFNRFDERLEEAARDMGASEWVVFKEVTLPLITPGIVAAGLFGFAGGSNTFSITLNRKPGSAGPLVGNRFEIEYGDVTAADGRFPC